MNIASTVRRELDNVDLLWSHESARDPAEAVRGRLTELLVDLAEFEAWCEDIRSTAQHSGQFEDMKNKVRGRDEKANELYPRVEGMLADLENMCDDLERRCESIRKCQQELQEAGAQMAAEGDDAEELLVCDKREMEVRLITHGSLFSCRRTSWLTRCCAPSPQEKLDDFYKLFDRNGFDEVTGMGREGCSVLGPELQHYVQELTAAQSRSVRILEQVARGEGFDAKDGASAVKSARLQAKAIWSKLVEADNVAAGLMVAGRDFLDSQLHMALGVRWEAGTLAYTDMGQARPGQVAKQWEPWTRAAKDCLDILRQTEHGTDGVNIDPSKTPRLYTVEGVNMLVELLMVRKDQLKKHPELVARKEAFGKAIVSADHQIDVLTHKLWILQNRALEHKHAEAIDKHLAELKSHPGPRNQDKIGPAGTFTINPDDDLRSAIHLLAREESQDVERWKREWEELSVAVRGQIEEATDKRHGLQELQPGLPELRHAIYRDWLRSDRDAMGKRLTYPFLAHFLKNGWDGEIVSQFEIKHGHTSLRSPFEEFYNMMSPAPEGVPPRALLPSRGGSNA